MTASKIITANVSSIVIGLWGRVSHLSFIHCHCLWRELFQSQSKDISHHNRLLYCNNSWHHQTASSVLMKIWWNEFQQQHFSPSIACEWGLPERKSPLITMYNILYPVFWNANDKASSHKSLLEWVYQKKKRQHFLFLLTLSRRSRYYPAHPHPSLLGVE